MKGEFRLGPNNNAYIQFNEKDEFRGHYGLPTKISVFSILREVYEEYLKEKTMVVDHRTHVYCIGSEGTKEVVDTLILVPLSVNDFIRIPQGESIIIISEPKVDVSTKHQGQ